MYVCVEVTYYFLVYAWTNCFTIQATAYIRILAHVWYQSHTILSVSPARVSQLCFKKLFCSEIKLAISVALESGQNTSGTSATEKVAALVARATCSGASHSSALGLKNNTRLTRFLNQTKKKSVR